MEEISIRRTPLLIKRAQGKILHERSTKQITWVFSSNKAGCFFLIFSCKTVAEKNPTCRQQQTA
jgi:hypothetical protein